jgi:uncharacterized membrane protein YedE/YeeE
MGFIFGVGLCLSGMVNPQKVIGFLDVAGHWDPSLAMVMAGALLVTVVSFRFVRVLKKPVCSDAFQMPNAQKVDFKLVTGSALFGIGWGLAGICPGPAVVALSFGLGKILIFFVSLISGMIFYERIFNRQ